LFYLQPTQENDMNHVRQAIGHQLIDALHQCNLADVQPDTNYPEESLANDLNTKCSMQHEAYGHIANALTSMGFNRAREVYASEGDVDDAHAEIDRQYQGVAA
jgi:hypothetical protein